MNVVEKSRGVAFALMVGSVGCGSGSLGPSPAESDGDRDVVSASSALHGPVQAKSGDPYPGLTQDQLARFATGKEEFASDETPEEGLGPVFNDTSCGRCHTDPAVGGGSALLESLRLFGVCDLKPLEHPLHTLGTQGIVGDDVVVADADQAEQDRAKDACTVLARHAVGHGRVGPGVTENAESGSHRLAPTLEHVEVLLRHVIRPRPLHVLGPFR